MLFEVVEEVKEDWCADTLTGTKRSLYRPRLIPSHLDAICPRAPFSGTGSAKTRACMYACKIGMGITFATALHALGDWAYFTFVWMYPT